MKRTIQNLTMAAALLLGAAAMSSCAGFVDALLGHEDTPAETPTKPTTSDANDGGSHEGSDMSLPPGAGFNRVDLSTLTEDYTFKDGDVLTGTLDGTKTVIKLSVAPDAKVILSGAQILGEDQGIWVNKWAGLTCLGNATIILDGENTVRSFDRSFPCIQAGPDGSKLIITGDGKLTTDGRSLAGIGSAENITCGDIEIQGGDLTLKDCGIGIGSGAYGSCGNITITGGTITVQGIHRAGIGNAGSSCGNITISGGIISTQGGEVGIGSVGDESSCGDITITGGTITAQSDAGSGIGCYGIESFCGDISISWSENFVSLTAIKGNEVDYPIGSTGQSNCGEITFNGTNIKERRQPVVSVHEGAYRNLIFTISTTLPEGVDETDEEAVKPYKDNTWTLTPKNEDE
jgi:hypothetical protein